MCLMLVKVKNYKNEEVAFKMKKTAKFAKMFQAYAKRDGTVDCLFWLSDTPQLPT
jgi:hypothetical protein